MCKYVRVREQFSNVREASSTTADMTVVAVANDSNVNSLAFVPVTLSFRDLYYTIDVGTRKNKTTRQLLKGIHGCFQPGMLTALMGSTGAGKTTLMDVIAGRMMASVIEGDMFVNGHPLVRQTFNSVFGYCEQTDMHEGTATIREAFLFSASLRLPSYTTEFIITLTVTRRFWPPLTPRIMTLPGGAYYREEANELKPMRQAYDAEALRASRAEALVEQLHLRDAELRRPDTNKRMEEIASDLRRRALNRERSRERERAAWFDVNVKRETIPSQPSVSPTGVTSPDACVHATPPLLSGFAAPKALRYTGYSLEVRRMFAKQYYEYCNECAEATVSLVTKIGIRPIGTCIEAKAKSFAAMMHFGTDVALITNADWTQYFQYALNYHSPDFGDLEAKIHTTVVMDDMELYPDKYFDKWGYSYRAQLDKNNMMSFVKHPKNAVKALIEGIRPPALKAEDRRADDVAVDDSASKTDPVKEVKKTGKKDLTKPKAKALKWPDKPPTDGSCWAVVVDGGLDEPVPALLDSGCDSGTFVSLG
ncbi:hypothetical protein DYB32_009490 [Aphanomyces invadans]|uniref:ABC transporter domain-containing protein n=1 Tax=Aphanomyces invadans TaxID=157072 RepID=A0A418AI84_9STRA|nr:hypothetical protein DYB32_009490 [Aphanomyces invadans]